MPYDPRMLQAIGRMGIGMMAPPFQQPPQQQQRRAPEWWEQPLPQRKDQPADQDKDPSQDPDRPKQPPSLLDMMVDYHDRQRPRSKHTVQYGQPDGTVTASPWAFLGNLGSGGPPR
jgi:hypothetical protein